MSGLPDSPTASTLLPLVHGDPDRVLALSRHGRHTVGRFIAHVHGAAALLPPAGAVVNLCEDRYRFLVALCAAALRGQTTLLPPSRAPEAVRQSLADRNDGYVLADTFLPGLDVRCVLPDVLPEAPGGLPRLAADAPLVLGFTSGSTGIPKAHMRTLGMFTRSTAQNHAALCSLWTGHGRADVLATVPSQHMYGMELAVMWPLLASVVLHTARPLFPEEVRAALARMDAPRVLVTTPVHLKALTQSRVAWPELAGVVCSTAPLPVELAQAAETAFGCEVRELFGSTETLIIASRRTAVERAWTPFAGIRFEPHTDHSLVRAPHLPEPVAIADVIEPVSGGRFHLRGRQADVIDIAGKRASLGDIAAKLLRIPGVQDAAVVQLPVQQGMVQRVAAAVVAPGLDASVLLDVLRQHLDPVFLPRPLKLVTSLPRNETGKLPRDQVIRLLDD